MNFRKLSHLNYRKFLLNAVTLAALVLGAPLAQSAADPTVVKPSLETGRLLAHAFSDYLSLMQFRATNQPEALRQVLRQSFGEKLSDSVANELVEMAKNRRLPVPARIMVVQDEVLKDAAAAYLATKGGTVLIAARFEKNYQALLALVTEECGHHLDECFGGADAKGDEGEIFAAGVFCGEAIANTRLLTLQAQNDHTELQFEGEIHPAELFFLAKFGSWMTGGIINGTHKFAGGVATGATMAWEKGLKPFGEGVGDEFSNFGIWVDGEWDYFWSSMGAVMTSELDPELSAQYAEAASAARHRADDAGSQLIAYQVGKAIEGMAVDIGEGTYHFFSDLNRSIKESTAALIFEGIAALSGDPARAEKYRTLADEARQRSKESLKSAGTNILKVATAPGNLYNETVAILNEEVPGLGFLLDLGAGTTVLAPFIIAAAGTADIVNAIQNNPDDPLKAGLLATVFVAVDVAGEGAGRYATKLGKARDVARVSEAAHQTRLNRRLRNLEILNNQRYRNSDQIAYTTHWQPDVQTSAYSEAVFPLVPAGVVAVGGAFIPGRDRDENRELQGTGSSLVGNLLSDDPDESEEAVQEYLDAYREEVLAADGWVSNENGHLVRENDIFGIGGTLGWMAEQMIDLEVEEEEERLREEITNIRNEIAENDEKARLEDVMINGTPEESEAAFQDYLTIIKHETAEASGGTYNERNDQPDFGFGPDSWRSKQEFEQEVREEEEELREELAFQRDLASAPDPNAFLLEIAIDGLLEDFGNSWEPPFGTWLGNVDEAREEAVAEEEDRIRGIIENYRLATEPDPPLPPESKGLTEEHVRVVTAPIRDVARKTHNEVRNSGFGRGFNNFIKVFREPPRTPPPTVPRPIAKPIPKLTPPVAPTPTKPSSTPTPVPAPSGTPAPPAGGGGAPVGTG
ncbi:MAG: hypothetical protein ACI8UO_004156 [Verrucomicrobiales bacterium]|jgi:hypothetical protein